MKPRIETIPGKKLVGTRQIMSFSNNQTAGLWKNFMQRRNEIHNNIGAELYSMQIYAPGFFDHFNPATAFEKWAATEVTDFNTVPAGMETIILPGGLYAVFMYKGTATTAAGTFQYILGTWLPNSEYTLDSRPHFEILGEKYKNNHPDSEEEIWIPIKSKNTIS
jgi:AraC family transcriptional regulator